MIPTPSTQISPNSGHETFLTDQLSPVNKNLLVSNIYQNPHNCHVIDKYEPVESDNTTADSRIRSLEAFMTSPKAVFAKANRLRKSLPARMKRKESKMAASRVDKASLLDDILSEASSPEVMTSLSTAPHAHTLHAHILTHYVHILHNMCPKLCINKSYNSILFFNSSALFLINIADMHALVKLLQHSVSVAVVVYHVSSVQ